ncbi:MULTISPECIES: hypothetical protein [unclassified Streptomyces]|uniref:hypothetical protein n=1 Tax=unclassified Streptomyces TaxID=2593676 RepID=UPI00381DE17A
MTDDSTALRARRVTGDSVAAVRLMAGSATVVGTAGSVTVAGTAGSVGPAG